MAPKTARNGSDSLPEPDLEKEFSTAESARIVGVSRTSFQRLVGRGLLKARVDASGQHFYKYGSLIELKETGAFGLDDEKVSLAEAQNELTSDALDHVRKTFALVHEPATSTMQILKEENKELRAYARGLEAAHLELIKTREELLSEKHARELALQESQASIRRKDAAIETLKSGLGPLAQKWLAAKEAESAMLQLLRRIPPEKLSVLHQFLEPEEQRLLSTVLDTAGVKLPDSEPTTVETTEDAPSDQESQSSV